LTAKTGRQENRYIQHHLSGDLIPDTWDVTPRIAFWRPPFLLSLWRTGSSSAGS